MPTERSVWRIPHGFTGGRRPPVAGHPPHVGHARRMARAPEPLVRGEPVAAGGAGPARCGHPPQGGRTGRGVDGVGGGPVTDPGVGPGRVPPRSAPPPRRPRSARAPARHRGRGGSPAPAGPPPGGRSGRRPRGSGRSRAARRRRPPPGRATGRPGCAGGWPRPGRRGRLDRRPRRGRPRSGGGAGPGSARRTTRRGPGTRGSAAGGCRSGTGRPCRPRRGAPGRAGRRRGGGRRGTRRPARVAAGAGGRGCRGRRRTCGWGASGRAWGAVAEGGGLPLARAEGVVGLPGQVRDPGVEFGDAREEIPAAGTRGPVHPARVGDRTAISPPAQLEAALNKYLELKLITCDQATTEQGLAYYWTHLGRECVIPSLADP